MEWFFKGTSEGECGLEGVACWGVMRSELGMAIRGGIGSCVSVRYHGFEASLGSGEVHLQEVTSRGDGLLNGHEAMRVQGKVV
jgi:hypothetical protein